ncbi:odorant receptor 22a-like [Drosophila bipectinata]|uniref:odorant receptor 22a-like n=1 Tax=Drosophila bipectinata TaxID=42026 RepID=UPI0038B30418
MLGTLFPWIKEKSLEEKVKSRDAFIYLDRGMYLVGWKEPLNKRWTLISKIWTGTTSIMLIVLLPISMVMEYIHNFDSFSVGEFLSSLEICVNMYGCSFKSSFTMFGHSRIQVAKKLLDEMDSKCHRTEEWTRLHRYVALSNLLFIVYFILYSTYVVVNFTGYLLMGSHAWRLYNPFLDSEKNFFASNIVEFLLMSAVVLQALCGDLCPLTYLFLGRLHITFFKERLSRLYMDPGKSDDEHLIDLNNCIRNHRLILEYVNVLRPVFSRTIFIQFLLIGVVLGFSMINVMFFANFWTGLGTCCFMFDICMETFPFCYLCDVIINDCNDLADTLFQSNWIAANRQYKVTLVYFLQNLQKPIVFKAGGIFPICMKTNLSMVKLAFSVVTVMKQLNLAEKFQ